jgi:hypothetical protein
LVNTLLAENPDLREFSARRLGATATRIAALRIGDGRQITLPRVRRPEQVDKRS